MQSFIIIFAEIARTYRKALLCLCKSNFVLAGLQLLVLQPGVVRSEEEAPSLKALICDPYILIASGEQLVTTSYWETSKCFALNLLVSSAIRTSSSRLVSSWLRPVIGKP
jgi:hypothetical protein